MSVSLYVCDVADLPPRQPSDGYQILDEVHEEPSAGTSSSQHHSRHGDQQQQQQQQRAASSTSDSDESSSEFGTYVIHRLNTGWLVWLSLGVDITCLSFSRIVSSSTERSSNKD